MAKKLTEDQLYYKVVTYNLKSFIMKYSKLVVQYKVGKYVKPRISYSKLMVFETLNDAISFAGSVDCYIYTCKVKNPQRIKKICWYNAPISMISNMWKSRKNKKKMRYVEFTIHNGTVISDAVMLLEEIKKCP